MAISPYYQDLRARIGSGLVLIPAVAVVVRDQRKRVLVLRTTDNAWTLPAGAVEPGEPPALAAARELHEECGLRGNIERVLAILGGSNCRVTYPNGDEVEYVVTVFLCTSFTGNLSHDNDETFGAAWFSPADMPCLTFPFPSEAVNAERQAAFFEWKPSWLDLLR